VIGAYEVDKVQRASFDADLKRGLDPPRNLFACLCPINGGWLLRCQALEVNTRSGLLSGGSAVCQEEKEEMVAGLASVRVLIHTASTS
jgi:hypothetical protein